MTHWLDYLTSFAVCNGRAWRYRAFFFVRSGIFARFALLPFLTWGCARDETGEYARRETGEYARRESGEIARGKTGAMLVSSAMPKQIGLELRNAVLGGNLDQVKRLLNTRQITIDEVIIRSNMAVDFRSQRFSCIFSKDEEWTTNMRPNSAPDPTIPHGMYIPLGAFGARQDVPTDTVLYGPPLMIAVHARNTFMVRELLKLGANPNIIIEAEGFDFPSPFDNQRRYDAYMNSRRRASYSGLQPDFSRSQEKSLPELKKHSCTRLCVLLDLYGRRENSSTMAEDDEIAEMLIKEGATLCKDGDAKGRTVLWDIAAVRSTYLLQWVHEKGLNLNHKDNFGETVYDYCMVELGKLWECDDRVRLAAFVKELVRLGGKGKEPSAPPAPRSIQNQVIGMGNGYPDVGGGSLLPDLIASGLVRKRDGISDVSAERTRILLRIRALQLELDDAQWHESDQLVLGMSGLSAAHRVSAIQQQIRDLEEELRELD